jgi:hypothetical protein
LVDFAPLWTTLAGELRPCGFASAPKGEITAGGMGPSRFSIALATACCAFAVAVPASATTPVVPWDGTNPFRCQNQNVGTGVDFPHPEADPFCVEFDKTQQNITDFGIVDFLAMEPARVAAAVPKCFYFQHDHWTGSIVQGQPPELWHWDGSYFFDKARGIGGVYVSDLQSALFGPVTGGVRLVSLGSVDPICAAKVDTPQERRRVYRRGGF